MRSCAFCMYWEQSGERAVGQCRVLPPTAGDEQRAVFPLVSASMWCGRYEESKWVYSGTGMTSEDLANIEDEAGVFVNPAEPSG